MQKDLEYVNALQRGDIDSSDSSVINERFNQSKKVLTGQIQEWESTRKQLKNERDNIDLLIKKNSQQLQDAKNALESLQGNLKELESDTKKKIMKWRNWLRTR